MITTIQREGVTVALVIRPEPIPGIKFFTEESTPLQVACMIRPAGYIVRPHTHPRVVRTIYGTPEVLFLRRGYASVVIDRKPYLLCPGDVVVILDAEHSLEVLEDSEIWEVKQGPYLGDADKVFSAPLWEGGPNV